MSLPEATILANGKAVLHDLQDISIIYLTEIHIFILNYLHPEGKAIEYAIYKAVREQKRAVKLEVFQDRVAELVRHGYVHSAPSNTRNIKAYYSITVQGIALLELVCKNLGTAATKDVVRNLHK